jgi:PST family polysaccharide transporter
VPRFLIRRVVIFEFFKKRLVVNFLSLANIQVVSYLIPFVTIPYLVRVLGPDRFGLVAFSQAFIQYFAVVTDYGFNISTTKKISVSRNDREGLSSIVSTVFGAKALLFLLSAIVFLAIVVLVPKFRDDALLYCINFGYVFGALFFPSWYFQGVERMQITAVLRIIERCAWAVLIFVFIRKEEDYLLVPAFQAICAFGGSLGAVMFLRKYFGVVLCVPDIKRVLTELKEGWHIFLTIMSTSLFSISNTMILGFFTNNATVGYYSAGEKIIKAALIFREPFLHTVYPHVCKLCVESTCAALQLIKRTARLAGAISAVFSVLLCIYAGDIVRLVLGNQYEQSIPMVRILSAMPLLTCLSLTYTHFFLLAFGYTRQWSRVVVSASLASVGGAFLFVGVLDLRGAGVAVNVIMTELLILGAAYLLYKKIILAKPAPVPIAEIPDDI